MSWAAQEFEGLELGDARRIQRLIQLVDDLSAQPTGSIPLACGGWGSGLIRIRVMSSILARYTCTFSLRGTENHPAN